MRWSVTAWMVLCAGCDLTVAEETRLTGEAPSRAPDPPVTAAPNAEPAPVVLAVAKALPALSPGPQCPDHLRCDYGALGRDPTLLVTAIRVEKADHQLHLLSGETVVKSYSVALGYGGPGPKLREGDGVTPVGTYKITGRLPTSPWHVLLGVSYPNYEDVKRFARLKAAGEIPPDAGIGFGIAIHGRRADMADGEHKQSDWTLGCIAVDNQEIEEISRLVKTGTTITIVD